VELDPARRRAPDPTARREGPRCAHDRSVRARLARYARWVERSGVATDDLDDAAIASFLGDLARQGISARFASATALRAARLLRVLPQERHVKRSPLALVVSPRLARKLPSVLTARRRPRAPRGARRRTPRGLRDAAMLHTMYAAGLRASELVTLALGDLHLESGFVQAFGKGRKRRLVPLGDVAITFLRHWLDAGRGRWARAGERSSS